MMQDLAKLIADEAEDRDRKWLVAYEGELGVRGNVFRMTEAECQAELQPIRDLVEHARALKVKP